MKTQPEMADAARRIRDDLNKVLNTVPLSSAEFRKAIEQAVKMLTDDVLGEREYVIRIRLTDQEKSSLTNGMVTWRNHMHSEKLSLSSRGALYRAYDSLEKLLDRLDMALDHAEVVR